LPRVDPEKKKAIMQSPEFQVWWQWRRGIYPVPSDPFRAFMIDLGIPAKLHPEEAWRKRVNRADVVPVDYPRELKPLQQPIIRSQPLQQPVLKYKKRIEILQKAAEEFTKHYGVPMPQLRFVPEESHMEASYKPFGIGESPSAAVVTIGLKGTKHLALATLFHELGHHVQHVKQPFVAMPRSQKLLWMERQANLYAKPFLKLASQRWYRRMAMQSYLQYLHPSKYQTYWWKPVSKASSLSEAMLKKAMYQEEFRKLQHPFKVAVAKLTRKGKPTGEYAVYLGKPYAW